MTFDAWWAKSIPFASETDVETRLVKGVSRLSWAAARAEQHEECDAARADEREEWQRLNAAMMPEMIYKIKLEQHAECVRLLRVWYQSATTVDAAQFLESQKP